MLDGREGEGHRHADGGHGGGTALHESERRAELNKGGGATEAAVAE